MESEGEERVASALTVICERGPELIVCLFGESCLAPIEWFEEPRKIEPRAQLPVQPAEIEDLIRCDVESSRFPVDGQGTEPVLGGRRSLICSPLDDLRRHCAPFPKPEHGSVEFSAPGCPGIRELSEPLDQRPDVADEHDVEVEIEATVRKKDEHPRPVAAR